MTLFDAPILNHLEGYLDVAAARQSLIASNMANIDTPGYRTQDLNFQTALSDAEAGLNPGAAQETVPGLLQRPDGNNVNLDRESFLMAQTQLQYSTGIALLKEEFHRLSMAINGGGSQGA
ncbi:MAG TPA: flagellar basal body protein [Terriglobales bacterium]|nr:flagellar basal body protein [Terriglobales bacterium]